MCFIAMATRLYQTMQKGYAMSILLENSLYPTCCCQGDKTVKLLMQLKLNEGIKNSFEYCEVHMPFFHR